MAPKLYLIEGANCDIVKVYESSSLIGCLCRKIGILYATLYYRKKDYGEPVLNQVKKFKQLR